MSMYEVVIIVLYLCMLLSSLVMIQMLNPGKIVREKITVEDTNEKFVQSEFEEPDSDSDNEKQSFHPEKQNYIMTENSMLRQRRKESADAAAPSELEMVD